MLGTAGAVGSIGTARARPPDTGELRLFGETAVSGATEAVTQGNLAFVATGEGLAVVDWRSPGRPELLVRTDVPGVAVWDVKVDGDLLAISSQGENERGDDGDPAAVGTHFYDVSDPADPQFRGTWTELPAGVHNHFLADDIAYICREAPFDDSALKIVDVSDLSDPRQVTRISAPDVSGFRTSHNFDVTANRLHSSWYGGGVRLFDVTAPEDPEELSVYRTDDTSFWTAVSARSFTVASDVGGGLLLLLHDDRGTRRPPAFGGERAGGSGPGPEHHARPE